MKVTFRTSDGDTFRAISAVEKARVRSLLSNISCDPVEACPPHYREKMWGSDSEATDESFLFFKHDATTSEPASDKPK